MRMIPTVIYVGISGDSGSIIPSSHGDDDDGGK